MFERTERPRQHAALVERLERVPVAVDVQLKAHLMIERSQLVRSNFRGNVLCAQERKRTACNRCAGEVEMHGNLAAPAQMDAARGVEETGQLGQAVAVGHRHDRGELVAQMFRE